MAAFVKFNSFVQALAHGEHDFATDALGVALTNTLPDTTDSVLADITEISYTGVSSRVITTLSSSQTAGTYKLTLQDLVLTCSSDCGPFRYVVIYNNSHASDGLICYFDQGSNITIFSGGEYTINFDGTDGLFRIT